MQEKVELRPSFSWTCPSCGRDNFERGHRLTVQQAREYVRAQGDPEYYREVMERLEASGQETALMAPTEVTCGHCGAGYETEEV